MFYFTGLKEPLMTYHAWHCLGWWWWGSSTVPVQHAKTLTLSLNHRHSLPWKQTSKYHFKPQILDQLVNAKTISWEMGLLKNKYKSCAWFPLCLFKNRCNLCCKTLKIWDILWLLVLIETYIASIKICPLHWTIPELHCCASDLRTSTGCEDCLTNSVANEGSLMCNDSTAHALEMQKQIINRIVFSYLLFLPQHIFSLTLADQGEGQAKGCATSFSRFFGSVLQHFCCMLPALFQAPGSAPAVQCRYIV